MQIIIGTYYVNKTWKYLVPCLSDYGSTFKAKYNSLFKLATGVHDCIFDGTKYENGRYVYILIDKLYRPAVTQNILQWMTYQSCYVTSYAFDDLVKGRKHMLVLSIPELYNDSYDSFIKGSYSQMYSDNQIDILFPDPTNEVRAVLKRTKNAYSSFITKVNSSFDSNITKKDLIGAELDFPLEKGKEFFNYK